MSLFEIYPSFCHSFYGSLHFCFVLPFLIRERFFLPFADEKKQTVS